MSAPPPETTALARRLTIPEAVAVYERAAADIREAFRMVADAEKRLNEALSSKEWRTFSVSDYSNRIQFDAPEESIKRVRRQVWEVLIDRLEVRRIMSPQRARELDEAIEKDQMPEISERTLNEVFGSLMAALPQMLEEAVEEVFDWLRPRASRYKSNSEYEVPRKVVLSNVVSALYDWWSVNDYSEKRLTALENVFSALDGKGQITKAHWSAISIALRENKRASETPYFKFQAFRNGNLHITMKREDLLARFNQIAGGRRLRAGKGGEDG